MVNVIVWRKIQLVPKLRQIVAFWIVFSQPILHHLAVLKDIALTASERVIRPNMPIDVAIGAKVPPTIPARITCARIPSAFLALILFAHFTAFVTAKPPPISVRTGNFENAMTLRACALNAAFP
jgi:hypothetical protein